MGKIKLTYKEWQLLGWQVCAGRKSFQKNERKEATFSGNQVYKA
jgi:hypothetical protein